MISAAAMAGRDDLRAVGLGMRAFSLNRLGEVEAAMPGDGRGPDSRRAECQRRRPRPGAEERLALLRETGDTSGAWDTPGSAASS